MPLTKDYQRYAPTDVYGCISGDKSNAIWMPDKDGSFGKYCVTGCGEKIAIFDLATRQRMALLPEDSEDFSAISCLACKQDDTSTSIAAGYKDGWVRLFDPWSGNMDINMRGHNKAITCLAFSTDGRKLFCGSLDKDITVVDMETESGGRLKGHQSRITAVRPIPNKNILVSSSLDGIIKFWDLSANFCFRTLPSHQNEILDLLFLDESLLLSATSKDLILWQIKFREEESANTNDESAGDDVWPITSVEKLGTVERQTAPKIEALVRVGPHFITVIKDRKCEVFLKKKSKKKLKSNPPTQHWQSVVCEFSSKTVSVDAVLIKDTHLQLLGALINNSLETRPVPLSRQFHPPRPLRLEQLGHRFPPHTICVSESGSFILSVSQSEAKLFNRQTNQFVDSFTWPDTDEGEKVLVTCASFAPGERHVLLGCESGALMLYDVASRQCLTNIAAHEDAMTGVKLVSKKSGAQEEIVSGGLDKSLRMWRFKINRCLDPSLSAKTTFSLELRRHVDMPDKVTALCASPDGRLIAAALLDTSIRLVLADSLKVCLSLRGHSLPVRTLDVSSDSMKLVSGSDDKTVRVWGLQFGDCQTAFHGHESAISGVAFLPRSDLLFSAARDRSLRLWDAAKFRRVMLLRGHQAEVTSIGAWRGAGAGLEPEGEDGGEMRGEPRFVVTAGRDRTLRVWEEREELVVLEEEEELERERDYAEELAFEGDPLPGAESERVEHQLASKKTLETVKAAERIMESIDEVRKERAVQEEWRERQRQRRKRKRTSSGDAEAEADVETEAAKPPANVLFAAYDAASEEEFLLEVVSRVRRSDLERALLELPFEYVRELLPFCAGWLERRWDVELATRVSTFLLHLHHGVIASNQMLAPVLQRLAKVTRPAAKDELNETDFVMAGLELLMKSIPEIPEESLFDRAAKRRKNKQTKFLVAE